MRAQHRPVATLTLCLVLPAASALAQPVGAFRWQIQPYCNVIRVAVTHQSGIYTLDGTDDRCGADQAASVVGLAHLTASGLVGFGLTSVLPGGTAVHTEATISLASLSGTWRDSVGNNGAFIFTPGAGIGGAPRPIPVGGIAAASITNIHLASNAVTGANIVDASITSADISDGVRVAFAGGDSQLIEVQSFPTIIRSVTVNAPAAGKVIVNASGSLRFNDHLTAEDAACDVTAGNSIPFNTVMRAREFGTTDAVLEMPFGIARGFNVGAGSTTFTLMCREDDGTVVVRRSSMTAIYSPQ